MKKSFSFVLVGALGFSAAVGASSFGTNSKLSFEHIANNSPVSGASEDGYVFTAVGANFTVESEGDKAVFVATTIGPFDDSRVSTMSMPFFLVAPDSFDHFQFSSVILGGSIFDVPDTLGNTAAIDVFGLTSDNNEVGTSLDVFSYSPGNFSASLFGLEGINLKSLRFSSSAIFGGTSLQGTSRSGSASLTLFSEPSTSSITGLTVDELGLEAPSQVPLPASALLLGTGLLGAGAFARRKKNRSA